MILILSALKIEIKPILDEMDAFEKINIRSASIIKGSFLGKDVLAGFTGVGSEKMEQVASFCMREYKPDVAVNMGFCGALSPMLLLGDIITPSSVIDRESGKKAEPTLSIKKIDGFKCHNGAMLTVSTAVASPHEKAYLGTKFAAVAVDMESFGFATAGLKNNVPYGIIRSVLDPMDMHLPNIPEEAVASGVPSIMGIASTFIKHPKEILSLPQLKYCADESLKTLFSFTKEFIGRQG